jgi:hypothetical protein
MMQSRASPAMLWAAGSFFRSASSAMFEYGFPPLRIVASALRRKNQHELRMVLSDILADRVADHGSRQPAATAARGDRA